MVTTRHDRQIKEEEETDTSTLKTPDFHGPNPHPIPLFQLDLQSMQCGGKGQILIMWLHSLHLINRLVPLLTICISIFKIFHCSSSQYHVFSTHDLQLSWVCCDILNSIGLWFGFLIGNEMKKKRTFGVHLHNCWLLIFPLLLQF